MFLPVPAISKKRNEKREIIEIVQYFQSQVLTLMILLSQAPRCMTIRSRQ